MVYRDLLGWIFFFNVENTRILAHKTNVTRVQPKKKVNFSQYDEPIT